MHAGKIEVSRMKIHEAIEILQTASELIQEAKEFDHEAHQAEIEETQGKGLKDEQ
ncbi:MAG: hypothetical protein HQ515_07640 [Phycisphaeraceae bacterium]|nr:hypothetical protein [Phycisphaeraceae bacterium]